MRIALAVLLVAHGIAHLVGFAGTWGMSPNIPYRTTVLDGRVQLGARALRLLGIAWLACALAFVTAGTVALGHAAWWPSFTAVVATVSLVLCIVQWPQTRIGVALNLAILAALCVR